MTEVMKVPTDEIGNSFEPFHGRVSWQVACNGVTIISSSGKHTWWTQLDAYRAMCLHFTRNMRVYSKNETTMIVQTIWNGNIVEVDAGFTIGEFVRQLFSSGVLTYVEGH